MDNTINQVISTTDQQGDIIILYAASNEELARLISDDTHKVFGIHSIGEDNTVYHDLKGLSWSEVMRAYHDILTDLIGYYTDSDGE